MNPLEDIIIAVRAITLVDMPFKVPNSMRLLDPTLPQGTTTQFTGVDPSGNPVTVTNEVTNFGSEYVWHCHLLGHEENDMMRALCIAQKPEAPSGAAVTAVPGGLRINWTNNSIIATSIKIQRALDNAFTNQLVTFNSTTALTSSQYTDTTAQNNVTYYYRVIATNTIGSTASGYPTVAVDSNPSNTASGQR
jgi:hypothetical protein